MTSKLKHSRRKTPVDWHRWSAIGAIVIALGAIVFSCAAVAEPQPPADPLGQFLRWLYPPPPHVPTVPEPPPPPLPKRAAVPHTDPPPVHQSVAIVAPPPPRSIMVPERPRAKPKPKARAKVKRGLPSCAYIKRQYDAMTRAQRFARYLISTPEEVAHGRKCLGI